MTVDGKYFKVETLMGCSAEARRHITETESLVLISLLTLSQWRQWYQSKDLDFLSQFSSQSLEDKGY